MLSKLIVVAVLLLLLGPLRRRFVSAWRFTFPAVAGAVLGLVLAGMFVSAGAPGWLLIFGPIVAAFMFGAAGKRWLDDNLGPPRQGGE